MFVFDHRSQLDADAAILRLDQRHSLRKILQCAFPGAYLQVPAQRGERGGADRGAAAAERMRDLGHACLVTGRAGIVQQGDARRAVGLVQSRQVGKIGTEHATHRFQFVGGSRLRRRSHWQYGRCAQPARQRVTQGVGPDRFRNEIIHAGRDAFFLFVLCGACGQRNHRRVRGTACFQRAYIFGGLVAVEFRHLAVHQDQFVRRRAMQVQRLPAVAGDFNGATELFQHAHRDLLIDRIVIGHEYPFSGQRRIGLNRAAGIARRCFLPFRRMQAVQCCKQGLRLYRLFQHRRKPGCGEARRISAERAQHDQRDILVPRIAGEGGAKDFGIHAAQTAAENDDTVRRLRRRCLRDRGQRRRGIVNRVDAQFLRRELRLQRGTLGARIIGQQQPGAGRLRRRPRQFQRQPELRTGLRQPVDADAATHHVGEFPAKHQL